MFLSTEKPYKPGFEPIFINGISLKGENIGNLVFSRFSTFIEKNPKTNSKNEIYARL